MIFEITVILTIDMYRVFKKFRRKKWQRSRVLF